MEYKCGKCEYLIVRNPLLEPVAKNKVIMADNTQMWEMECPKCFVLNYYPIKTYRHDTKRED